MLFYADTYGTTWLDARPSLEFPVARQVYLPSNRTTAFAVSHKEIIVVEALTLRFSHPPYGRVLFV